MINYLPFMGGKEANLADPKTQGRFDMIDNTADDLEVDIEGTENSSLIDKTKNQVK